MSTQTLQETVPQKQSPTGEPFRRTLLDNEEVLVVATTYPRGATVPIHTHRFPNVAYVIEGGTIETIAPDGSVGEYELRAGETLWSPAGHVHSARNIGSTPVRIVETEIKHAAPRTPVGEGTPRVLAPADLKWETDRVDPRRS